MRVLITIILVLCIPVLIVEFIIRYLAVVFVALPVWGYSVFWGIDVYGLPDIPKTRSAKIMHFLMEDVPLTVKLLMKLKNNN